MLMSAAVSLTRGGPEEPSPRLTSARDPQRRTFWGAAPSLMLIHFTLFGPRCRVQRGQLAAGASGGAGSPSGESEGGVGVTPM